MPVRKRRRKRTPKSTLFGALGLEVATLLAIVAVAQPTFIATVADNFITKIKGNFSQSPNELLDEKSVPATEPTSEHHIASFQSNIGSTPRPTYR